MADDAPKDETPPALATAPDEGEPKASVSFDSNEKKGSSDAILTDEVEWVSPSKQEIELNARKARVGSRAASAMAPPVYFDDERRETLTDEELLIANPHLDEEENKRICYYFKTKTQCYTTVFLTTLFLLAIILMGIFIPRYLDCSYGCVGSIERLKKCFANGSAETLQMCPGYYSVYSALQIYTGRKALIKCAKNTPEDTCTFEAPTNNQFYIINFGAGEVTFQDIIFTSSIRDDTGLALFAPTFFTGFSIINFEYCSFINSPQGFAINSESSSFTNCLISGNGGSDPWNGVAYDDGCDALNFSPTILSDSGEASFTSCIFEDNYCSSTVNLRRSDESNTKPIVIKDSTFRNNQADYMLRLGGDGLKAGGVSMQNTLIQNNTVTSSLFRINQDGAPVNIDRTTFEANKGPALSIRNANPVTLTETSFLNNTNFVVGNGVVDPLISINGAGTVNLAGVVIDQNNGVDTIDPSNEDASILSITNVGRNDTVGSVNVSSCILSNNVASGAIATITGFTSLIVGLCQNKGTIKVESCSFENNTITNPTNVKSVLNAQCANSITASNSMFTFNTQTVIPPRNDTSAPAVTYEPLINFATPATQDSLVESCILENNDWSSVGVMLDTGSGLLPGGTIRNTCFNSGTYSGTGNAAAVAAFPYEPGLTQLQTISNSNFYGPGNTLLSTDASCPGAFYGFVDGGTASCAAFSATSCPVGNARS
jgi:hypothetical protein